MTPDQYCEDKTFKSGSSFYYSFFSLPPEKRKAIMALYAFCREIDDIVDNCYDISLARTKLQWWQEEIPRMFAANPQHPVTRALITPLQNFNLSQEYFQEFIKGMEMDLDYSSYPSFKELNLYCYRAAGVVGLLAAEIFGYDDSGTLNYAQDLGIALQLTNILRDVREDANRGRLYIPLDELDHFGVCRNDIFESRVNTGMQSLLILQAHRARQYYQQAFNQLAEVDRYKQRVGIMMAAIYLTVLDEIENSGYKFLDHRIVLSSLRKFWIVCRTLLIEKCRHRKFSNKGTGL